MSEWHGVESHILKNGKKLTIDEILNEFIYLESNIKALKEENSAIRGYRDAAVNNCMKAKSANNELKCYLNKAKEALLDAGKQANSFSSSGFKILHYAYDQTPKQSLDKVIADGIRTMIKTICVNDYLFDKQTFLDYADDIENHGDWLDIPEFLRTRR